MTEHVNGEGRGPKSRRSIEYKRDRKRQEVRYPISGQFCVIVRPSTLTYLSPPCRQTSLFILPSSPSDTTIIQRRPLTGASSSSLTSLQSRCHRHHRRRQHHRPGFPSIRNSLAPLAVRFAASTTARPGANKQAIAVHFSLAVVAVDHPPTRSSRYLVLNARQQLRPAPGDGSKPPVATTAPPRSQHARLLTR